MPLQVKRIFNKPIDSCCYVLFYKEKSSCLIIDPGTADCCDLDNFLNKKNIKPEYVILTHEHFDHIWGTEFLRNKYECQIICSPECGLAITDPKKNLSMFYNMEGFVCKPPDIVISETMTRFNWIYDSFELIKTPGHSPGSISIVIAKYLFSGDTLLKNKKTVTKLPGGNKAVLSESLGILSSMKKNIEFVFPGHGPGFKLSDMTFRLD